MQKKHFHDKQSIYYQRWVTSLMHHHNMSPEKFGFLIFLINLLFPSFTSLPVFSERQPLVKILTRSQIF